MSKYAYASADSMPSIAIAQSRTRARQPMLLAEQYASSWGQNPGECVMGDYFNEGGAFDNTGLCDVDYEDRNGALVMDNRQYLTEATHNRVPYPSEMYSDHYAGDNMYNVPQTIVYNDQTVSGRNQYPSAPGIPKSLSTSQLPTYPMEAARSSNYPAYREINGSHSSPPHRHSHPASYSPYSGSRSGYVTGWTPADSPSPGSSAGRLELPAGGNSGGHFVGRMASSYLACFFCRGRKIACGRPMDGSGDMTCNQCARRGNKCEYPAASRRGQHKRVRKAGAGQNVAHNVSSRTMM